MNKNRMLALAPALLIGACSTTGATGVDPDTVLLTQVAPQPIADCLGQAVGTTPAADDKGGYRVDAASAGGGAPAYLLITRDKVQTVVHSPGGPAAVPDAFSAAALKCVMQLSPPSNAVARQP